MRESRRRGEGEVKGWEIEEKCRSKERSWLGCVAATSLGEAVPLFISHSRKFMQAPSICTFSNGNCRKVPENILTIWLVLKKSCCKGGVYDWGRKQSLWKSLLSWQVVATNMSHLNVRPGEGLAIRSAPKPVAKETETKEAPKKNLWEKVLWRHHIQ